MWPPSIAARQPDHLAALPMPQLQFASEEASRWEWHRRPPVSPRSGGGPGSAARGAAFQRTNVRGRRYMPTAADAGAMLRVECTPAAALTSGASGADGSGCNGGGVSSGSANGGQPLRFGDAESFVVGPVEAGPWAATPIARRHAMTGALPFIRCQRLLPQSGWLQQDRSFC